MHRRPLAFETRIFQIVEFIRESCPSVIWRQVESHIKIQLVADIHLSAIADEDAYRARQYQPPLFGPDNQLVLLPRVTVDRPATVVCAFEFRINQVKDHRVLNSARIYFETLGFNG